MSRGGFTHGRDHHPMGTDPTVAIYEIKVVSDTKVVAVLDGIFKFAIPIQIAGWSLVRVSAYVTEVSSSGDVEVAVRNDTGAYDMADILISDGETCSGSNFIDDASEPVSQCDLIWLNVTQAGTGAKGLGVTLEFGKLVLQP